MLARTIACLGAAVTMLVWSVVSAQPERPNVVVLLTHGTGKLDAALQDASYPVFDQKVLLGEGKQLGSIWRGYRWDSRVSPGQVANLSALLYGRQPLLSGVVSDFDWRRKPVAGVSLAQVSKKHGYRSVFHGVWGMGMNLEYAPLSRGFDKFHLQSLGRLDDAWGSQPKKTNFLTELFRGPVATLLVSNRSTAALAKLVCQQAEAQHRVNKRETVIVIVRVKDDDHGAAVRGVIPGSGHYRADSFVYHFGAQDGFVEVRDQLKQARTDWELGAFLRGWLLDEQPEPLNYRIFHKANWPWDETPEKNRHRGSLIVNETHALVDGLKLYPVTKEFLPNLALPLDLAENQQEHAKLLMEYEQWWRKARVALHDPRAVTVGKEDNKGVRLTALDWRPSKIVHEDGSVPSSKPMIYQKYLTATLAGLQDVKYQESFPAYSGSWSIKVDRPGRYQITARLLPGEAQSPREKQLAKLKGGQAFVRLGRNKVQLNIVKGASAVSVLIDADAGLTDLECWFTGQLALDRELGAFFVEMSRVGDKKFDLKPKTGE